MRIDLFKGLGSPSLALLAVQPFEISISQEDSPRTFEGSRVEGKSPRSAYNNRLLKKKTLM